MFLQDLANELAEEASKMLALIEGDGYLDVGEDAERHLDRLATRAATCSALLRELVHKPEWNDVPSEISEALASAFNDILNDAERLERRGADAMVRSLPYLVLRVVPLLLDEAPAVSERELTNA